MISWFLSESIFPNMYRHGRSRPCAKRAGTGFDMTKFAVLINLNKSTNGGPNGITEKWKCIDNILHIWPAWFNGKQCYCPGGYVAKQRMTSVCKTIILIKCKLAGSLTMISCNTKMIPCGNDIIYIIATDTLWLSSENRVLGAFCELEVKHCSCVINIVLYRPW